MALVVPTSEPIDSKRVLALAVPSRRNQKGLVQSSESSLEWGLHLGGPAPKSSYYSTSTWIVHESPMASVSVKTTK